MNQETVYWIDPYANKKHDKELESYSTCVIDGYMWKVDSKGRTYCAGKVKGKEA